MSRPTSHHLADSAMILPLLACFLTRPVLAGTTGQLSGFVVDPDDSPLAGVSVTATSPSQIGGAQVTTTDERGRFLYPRLAPGSYTVRFDADGFVSQELTGVLVRLDRTADLTVALPKATFDDAVQVAERTPVVDPRQVSAGQVFSSEYLEETALGSDRRYIGVLAQAAGVSDSLPLAFSVLGASPYENAYLVDGLETTDPAFQWAGISSLSLDAIDEITFHTLGFEAEYGLATGGIVNLITKSGGNSLSGTFDARFASSDLAEKGDHHDPGSEPYEKSDLNVSVGGPIQQDRLWYFTSLQDLRSRSTPVLAPVEEDIHLFNLLAKLTVTPGPSWSINGKLIWAPITIENWLASQFRAPEATATWDDTTFLGQVNLSGVLSPNALLDLRLADHRPTVEVGPQDGDLSTIGHWNAATGENYGNFGEWWKEIKRRLSLGGDLDLLVDGAMGTHEIKTGLLYSATRYASNGCFLGTGRPCTSAEEGFFFNDLIDETGASIPFLLLVKEAVGEQKFRGSITSAFLQDSWRPGPRVTLNAGLRWDRSVQENDVGTEVADLSMAQPRFGIAWDVAGKTRSVLRASLGRYMHPSSLHIAEFTAERSTPTEQWYSCSLYLSPSPEECVALAESYGLPYRTDPEAWDPAGWVLIDIFSSQPARTSTDLEPMYADELLVAFERELFPQTSLELSFVRRDTRNVFEDTCNGNLPTPGVDAVCDYFVVTNLPDARRDYRGWILRLESRAIDRLHLNASYVYSDSKGSTEGLDTTDAFDFFPVHFDNRYGYLTNHSRHRVKLGGFVRLPRAFTLALNARWDSEWRWTAQSRLAESGLYGSLFTEPRGASRESGTYDVDIQVTKSFDLGSSRLKLIGTIHNLLSPEGITSVCTFNSGCGEVALGQALEWQLPRSYEFGARFEF